MIPVSEKEKKDEVLFVSIQWYMMYATHCQDDKIYRDAKKEFLKHISKNKYEEMEHKVLNSSSLNAYFRDRGVEGRIVQ